MLRTLALKELRETIWLPGLALVVFFLFSPGRGRSGMDLIDRFPPDGLLIWSGLAIALGFRQSVWESWRDTYVYLLSRPVSRPAAIGVKLATGLILVLIASAIPILYLGWRSVAPGNFAMPFEWSMTESAWKVWASMGPLYLASFLCGVRPGKWFGTRLWPLAAAIGLSTAIAFLPWWSTCGLGATVLVAVGLVLCVLHVVRTRDY